MDDSINEYAKNLLESAKARKRILKLQEEKEEERKDVDGDEQMEEVVDDDQQQQVVIGGDDEQIQKDEVEDEVEEMGDQVLPLTGLITPTPHLPKTLQGFTAVSGPISASPISRKSRLSALAQSINSWEDDLGAPKKPVSCSTSSAPTTQSPKTPRFSISTPPPTGRIPQQKQNNTVSSCHQFVSSKGPEEKVASPTITSSRVAALAQSINSRDNLPGKEILKRSGGAASSAGPINKTPRFSVAAPPTSTPEPEMERAAPKKRESMTTCQSVRTRVQMFEKGLVPGTVPAEKAAVPRGLTQGNEDKSCRMEAAGPITSPSKVSKLSQSLLVEDKHCSPRKEEKGEEKPKFYFGHQVPTIVPAASPSPPPKSPSPPRATTSSPSKNMDSAPALNISPSALIAKSVKKIQVVMRDDKMYPSLTDIEHTETEGETDVDNETNTSSVESSPAPSLNSSMSTSSLGSFIQNKAQAQTSMLSATMACRQVDELIDEALAGQVVDDDTFMMESSEPLSTSSPIIRKPPAPVPLMHTVSIYRKNQQQLKKSEDVENTAPHNLTMLRENEEGDVEQLHEKIQTLEQKVLIQQKTIAQSSKALNICEASFEFNNSTENVEGERVLLIATQKRSQLLSYISKLRQGEGHGKMMGVDSPSKNIFKPSSSTRGTMRIDSIQLYPIKSTRLHQDYLYHFIVIFKHEDNVHATSTVKTSANNMVIEFPNDFIIQELDPGFNVQVEVYALRTFKQIDVIPHNMKYHIKNSSTPSGSTSTPSKGSTLSHFLTPTRSSKHPPKATDLKSTANVGSALTSNSVRTSNFTLQSTLNLNLSNLNKTEWEMSLVNSNLILPNIAMNIKCTNKNELNYKGFLTVFSDVSGLGAWHRRWARLDEDYRILFWTYPEDEAHDKAPVLSVSLSSCITPRVSPTSREVCARPNTFLLVTTREPLPSDKGSLVVSLHEKYTAIKHMFSADNRTERDAWIGVINKALTNMRAWGLTDRDNSS